MTGATQLRPIANNGIYTGLPHPGSRDGIIYASHRATTIHRPAKDVQLHVCRPHHSNATFWIYGTKTLYRSQNPIVAKLQYGMKITFIFILILFIDSVNRVYRVQVEVYESKDQGA